MKKTAVKKRILLLLTIIIFAVSALPADTEVWMGFGFISHKAVLDPSEKSNFWAYLPQKKDDEGNNIPKDTSTIKSVTFIGPALDISVIPYIKVPIGLKLSTELLFPAGYNGGEGYRSFNFDFKNRNMLGITYDQSFSEQFGIFIEAGYEFDHYRIAATNEKNHKGKPEFNRFNNHALYAELGFLATVNNGYFKFGINYSHSIINKASSSDMIFAGGFKF